MRRRGKSLDFDDEEIDALTEMRSGDKRTFALLSLIFPHLDLRQHFHIDHVFPKSGFTPAKLAALGFGQAEVDMLRDSGDRLPNLQLLEGHDNVQKQATLPAKWLRSAFPSKKARAGYAATHLLGDVPKGLDGFADFYEARRLRLKDEIADWLVPDRSKSA